MDLQNQAILWSEPELVGWVEKRGDKSVTWNRRFFLLQGPYLFYYTKNTDIPTTEPVGVIPLEGAVVTDEDDSDTGKRFCFQLRLDPELATFAKRGSYHISAPSQEGKMVWMHALKMASFSRPYLLGELQAVREKASNLESLLAKSPSNLKELQRHQGHESSVLQKEIHRVSKAYEKLKEETIQICADADKYKKDVLQVLAVWEIYTDHMSGTNHKDNCHTVDRLNDEAALTKQLFKLLSAKRRYINGDGIDHLSSEALETLQTICKRGLANIQERRFQVRIKAPRYTSSIHPALLPEGCDDPVARISHPLENLLHERNSLERRKRKSTSLNLVKERDSIEQEALQSNEFSLQQSKPEALCSIKNLGLSVGSNEDIELLGEDIETQEDETESEDVAELERRELEAHEAALRIAEAVSNPEPHEAELSNTGKPSEQLLSEPPEAERSNTGKPSGQLLPKPPEAERSNTGKPSEQLLPKPPEAEGSNTSKPSGQLLPKPPEAERSNIGKPSEQLLPKPPETEGSNTSKPSGQLLPIPPEAERSNTGKPSGQLLPKPPGVERSTMEQPPQPPQPPPIPQKRVSFSRPDSLGAGVSFRPSPQERVSNDSEQFFAASARRAALEMLSPTTTFSAAIVPNQLQLLTRPQWVQLRPQTFNIIGPASIHTHDGSFSSSHSSTPGFESGHEMQPREDRSAPVPNTDRLQLRAQNPPPVVSNTDCQQPRKEKPPSVASNIDHQQPREEKKSLSVASKSEISEQREDEYPPVASRTHRYQPREEQSSPSVALRTHRYLPREQSSPSVALKSDRYQPREKQSSPSVAFKSDEYQPRKQRLSTVALKIEQPQPREEQRTPVAPKRDWYEAAIPSRIRALFQRMQPIPAGNVPGPPAKISSRPKRDNSPPRSILGPPRSPPRSLLSPTPATNFSRPNRRDKSPPRYIPVPAPATKISRPNSDHQDVTWKSPRAKSGLSPSPDSGRACAQVSPCSRPQSDLQHLLWTQPKAEHGVGPSHRTNNVCGRGPHQHTKSPQHAPHRCSKHHHFHPHTDHSWKKYSSPCEFQRMPYADHGNQNQTRQSQPQQYHHQCQHHHHNHPTHHQYNQEEVCPPEFHQTRTPRHSMRRTSSTNYNEGQFPSASQVPKNSLPDDEGQVVSSFTTRPEPKDVPPPRFDGWQNRHG